MNNDLTEIAFILDRSGSMKTMQQAAIDGFNEFLAAQATGPGEARLTLALFDHDYTVPYPAVPATEAKPLDGETYVPRGTTALLDAIGQTVDALGSRLAALPEAERPGTVIVAILTDGLENASRHFTWQQIHEKIQHQTDHYAWQFFFLGADQDAIATASRIGIARGNASPYAHDKVGYGAISSALARKALSARRFAAGDHDEQVKEELNAKLSAMVNEEDRKRRR